jgi:hypothetical protein
MVLKWRFWHGIRWESETIPVTVFRRPLLAAYKSERECLRDQRSLAVNRYISNPASIGELGFFLRDEFKMK